MRNQRLWSIALALLLTSPWTAQAQSEQPLDFATVDQTADFVPGEIIVKLRDSDNGDAGIQAFEAVAFAESTEPMGGGAFLVKLDDQLFEPENAESLQGRTAKAAQALQARADIEVARPDGPGKVIFKPTSSQDFQKSQREGRFEIVAFEGAARQLSNGFFELTLDPLLISPQSAASLRDRTLKAVEELKKRPDVEYVQLNYRMTYQLDPPIDPEFRNQWNFFNNGTGTDQSLGGINILQAWDQGRGSQEVVVAVIDSGILPDHSDIQGSPNLLPGFDMISNDSTANESDSSQSGRDPNPRDEGDAVAAGECGLGKPARPNSWHGSHVAGIIGVGNTNNSLGIAGLNWQVRVLPIRVLGKCGGSTRDINDAIRWAAGLTVPGVPNNPNPAHIINLSLGGNNRCVDSPDTQAAVNAAVQRGVTVIAAAGNSARDVSGFTPGGCDNVIAVAASDARGRLASRYSNFGAGIDIMAPGGEITRDDNQDGFNDGILSFVKDGLERYNGTSMAAPHVSGIAALMLANDRALTPAQILSRLQQNAFPRSTTQCPQACGAGLLNALFPSLVAPAATGAASNSIPE